MVIDTTHALVPISETESDVAMEELLCYDYPSPPWDRLPPLVIQRIFLCLPLTHRLQASSACSAWREILWSPDLWRSQSYLLNSSKAVQRLHFFCENQCLLYAKYLEIIWSAKLLCSRAQTPGLRHQILKVLLETTDTLKQALHLQKIVLKIERRRAHGKPLPCDISSEDLENCRKNFEQILQNNHNISYLSFGASPQEFHPNPVIENLTERAKESITDLHICTDLEGDVNDIHSVLTELDTFSLHHLQRLSIDWHNVTSGFLTAFNSRSSSHPLLKLNLFVLNHACSNAVLCHPENHEWRTFHRKNPDVKISLVFVNEVLGVCEQLKHVYPVFMVKFIECIDIDDVDYGKLVLWHKETIRAHVMVSTLDFMIELDNLHMLWLHMRGCTLKYITVIGYCIYEEIIKRVTSAFSPHLEVFHIPKNQILTPAEASYFMVPISGTQVNQLSRSMQSILNRPWRPLRRHPLQTNYFSDGYDDDFYLNAAPEDMLF